jgi:hypothetical protein
VSGTKGKSSQKEAADHGGGTICLNSRIVGNSYLPD